MSITNFGFQLSFDGVDEDMRCGNIIHNPTGPSGGDTNALTKAIWFKIEGFPLTQQFLMDFNDPPSAAGGFAITFGEEPADYIAYGRPKGTNIPSGLSILTMRHGPNEDTSLVKIDDGEWHFAAYTYYDSYDTTSPRVHRLRNYCDTTGPNEDSNEMATFLSYWGGAVEPTTFGGSVDDAVNIRFFNGYIGQAATWGDIELTPANIATLYASGNRFSDWSTMESSNLLAYWKMGNTANTNGSPKDTFSTIYDNKNSYNGTTANMTSSNLERIDNPSFVAPYQPFWYSNDSTSNDNSGYFFGKNGDQGVSTNAP